MVITPTDPKALVPIVSKFTAAGIPVINVNDRLAGGNVAAYVGSDDRAIARATAQALLKAMKGTGTVIILEGPPKLASSMARVQGFNDALKEFPNVKLLTSQTANYARKPAADLMNDSAPQISRRSTACSPPTTRWRWARSTRSGPIARTALVVGINASRDAADLIKSGQMVASGDFNGFIEGCVAAQLAIRADPQAGGAERGDPAHHRGRQEQCRALRVAGRKAHLPDDGDGGSELSEFDAIYRLTSGPPPGTRYA